MTGKAKNPSGKESSKPAKAKTQPRSKPSGSRKEAAPRVQGGGEAQQHAISDICRLALSSTEPAELLDHAAQVVANAMDVEAVGIFELSEDKRVFRLASAFGWSVSPDQMKSIPAAVCRPLYVALSAESAVRFYRF